MPCVVFLYCCQLSVFRVAFNRCWVRPLLQSLCHCTASACLCHSRVHTRCCFATLYQLLRLTTSVVLRCIREGQMIDIKPHFPCRPPYVPYWLIDWFTIGFETLRSRCTLASIDGPFVPHIILWEPCSYGLQTYTRDVPWLCGGGQMHMSEGSQSFTLTKNVGWGFILCSSPPTLRTVLSPAWFYHDFRTFTLAVFSNVATGHTSGRTGSCLWVALRVCCVWQ